MVVFNTNLQFLTSFTSVIGPLLAWFICLKSDYFYMFITMISQVRKRKKTFTKGKFYGSVGWSNVLHVEIQALLIGYQIVLANEFWKSNLLFWFSSYSSVGDYGKTLTTPICYFKKYLNFVWKLIFVKGMFVWITLQR